ncbi:MAG: Ig-like domain-containing protein [Muribaculaceae bacterium]|nr:Ig-like domain-containing protein [Muribaculaceae bacterium]
MQRMKKWIALMLIVSMAFGDCRGITAFAAGNAAAVGTQDSGKDEEGIQADEDTSGLSEEIPADHDSAPENGKNGKEDANSSPEDTAEGGSKENPDSAQDETDSGTNNDSNVNGNENTEADNDSNVNGNGNVDNDSDSDGIGNAVNEKEKIGADTKLPALHIGQLKEDGEFPDTKDPEFEYDLPVSFAMSDSVALFVNYGIDEGFEKEEEDTLVWSILRGKKDEEEGSVNLFRQEDDWTGFEVVSDSPYFTMVEDEDEDCPYKTVTLTAVESAKQDAYAGYEGSETSESYTDYEGSENPADYHYYIRAAFYLGTGEEKEETFYAAVTVPFLSEADMDKTNAEIIGAEQNPDSALDAEEVDAGQKDKADEENGDSEQIPEEASDTALISEESELEKNAIDLAEEETLEDEGVSALSENDETQQDAEPTIRITTDEDIDISSPMKPGGTITVTATVKSKDPQPEVVWKSNNKTVATVAAVANTDVVEDIANTAVDADGINTVVVTAVVTAHAEGKAQIIAECGDVSDTVTVEVVRENTDKMLDLSGEIWIAGFERESDAFVYTGQKITQDIRVYYNDILLTEKTDYTLTYKNNINAAAYSDAKAPSVTIKLKGQYSGSRTLYYTIKPRNINEVDSAATGSDVLAGQVALPGYQQTIVYSKKLTIPNPDLKYDKTKLKANKDFVCDYTPNVEGTSEGPQPMPENYKDGNAYTLGTVYKYTVNGTGNFTGSFQMHLVVVQNKKFNFGSATVTLDKKQYEYHGEPLRGSDVQIKTVKISGKVVEEGLYDYEVCAKEITGAYVLVYPNEAGKSAGYHGSKKVNLKLIGDRKLSDAGLGEKWKDTMFFSQKTLEEKGGFFQETTGVLTFGTGETQEILTEGQDYTVKYSNHKKVGKATVTFTGKGRYKGTLRKQYQIQPNVEPEDYRIVPGANVTRGDGVLVTPYQKGGASPEFTVKDKDNYVLKNKTDYTVKLINNKTPGETMSCVITGKGNYKGYSKSVDLQVGYADISQATLSVPDKAYSKKANAWKSKVTIKDVNGKLLKAGTDYDKNITYEYAGQESGQPPQAGTAVTVTVRGIGCYANEDEKRSIVTDSYRIYKDSISKLKIAIDAQEYTGAEITLVPRWESSENSGKWDIHVYANNTDMKKKQNEIADECYKIIEYKNNIKSGNAKVTLQGIGNYGGTKTYTFKIQKKTYGINHVKKITLDKANFSMRLADKKVELTATLIPETQGDEIFNSMIIWSVSNKKIATVETDTVGGAKATITFLKEGTVTITAMAQDGGKTAKCKITIVNVPKLVEADSTIERKPNDTYQLTLEWAESQEADTSKLKWSSNNPERVSVDKNGLITMKAVGAATITLRAGSSNYIQQCTVIVKDGEEVLPVEPDDKRLTYVQKPGTVDDAIEINKLLREWEWNPDKWDYLYIPAGVYKIGATVTKENGFGGIVLTENQKLIMSPSALLVAIGNNCSNDFHMIYAFGRDNVTISGGQLIGERDIHTGKGGESGHGIQIAGCTNVHISDVEISKCWGDGIWLGIYNNGTMVRSNGVTIENCNLHDNRRNNLSITDADNVTIDNCQFNYAKGTDPQFGIDIENEYGTTQNVKIYNSTFKGNARASLGIITAANGVRIENCEMDGYFYNDAGKNVVLKNNKIDKSKIFDKVKGIKYE